MTSNRKWALFLAAVVWLSVQSMPASAAASGGSSDPKPIRIFAGQLIDGVGGSARNVLVTVVGSKIASVQPNGARKGADYVFDRMTLLPGLIDTHTHLDSHFGDDGKIVIKEPPAQRVLWAYQNAYENLMAGFTTLQTLTSPSVGGASGVPLRDAIGRGQIPGPRIVASVELINEKSGTPEEIREKVRQQVAAGADIVKLFASKSIREHGIQTMSDEQIAAACQEAKALGKRTWVHAHSAESVRAAALAGCDAIAHGAFATEREFELMAQRGVFFEPEIWLGGANYMRNAKRFMGESNWTAEGFKLQEEAIAIKLKMFKNAIKHKNLKIAFGTDAIAGAHGQLGEEIVYRVKTAGQPPMDAIVQATSVPADALGLKHLVGAVRPGMEADLIAVEGDPLKNIDALTRVAFVMKGGTVYKHILGAQKS